MRIKKVALMFSCIALLQFNLTAKTAESETKSAPSSFKMKQDIADCLEGKGINPEDNSGVIQRVDIVGNEVVITNKEGVNVSEGSGCVTTDKTEQNTKITIHVKDPSKVQVKHNEGSDTDVDYISFGETISVIPEPDTECTVESQDNSTLKQAGSTSQDIVSDWTNQKINKYYSTHNPTIAFAGEPWTLLKSKENSPTGKWLMWYQGTNDSSSWTTYGGSTKKFPPRALECLINRYNGKPLATLRYNEFINAGIAGTEVARRWVKDDRATWLGTEYNDENGWCLIATGQYDPNYKKSNKLGITASTFLNPKKILWIDTYIHDWSYGTKMASWKRPPYVIDSSINLCTKYDDKKTNYYSNPVLEGHVWPAVRGSLFSCGGLVNQVSKESCFGGESSDEWLSVNIYDDAVERNRPIFYSKVALVPRDKSDPATIKTILMGASFIVPKELEKGKTYRVVAFEEQQWSATDPIQSGGHHGSLSRKGTWWIHIIG